MPDLAEYFDGIPNLSGSDDIIDKAVNDKKVFLETADKDNQHSNGLQYHLDDIDRDDLILCFSYKDMVNLMNILDIEKSFKSKFTYDVDNELGMMYVYAEDATEKYCLLSKRQG